MLNLLSRLGRDESLRSRLLLLFLSLLVLGCGGGSDNGGTRDFVFTGGNSVEAPGSMTFNFIQAQTPLAVPSDTTQLLFQFYSEPDARGTLVQQETLPFASTVTINPVNIKTRSVVVTALGSNGYPVLESRVNVIALAGEEVIVDFGSGTTQSVTQQAFSISPLTATLPEGGSIQFTATILFSNGQKLPADNVTWSSTGQASVDANSGLVTATTSGKASVTATRGTDSATADIIVGDGPVLTALTVTPDGATAGTGAQVQFSVSGVDQNGADFPLTGVVWSVESGAVTIGPTGLADCPTATVATIRAAVGSVFDETTLTVLNSVPAVSFGGTSTGQLIFIVTESPTLAAMGDITVTDDQPNLAGGILRFRLGAPGNILDATFSVPATTIGTVSNNDSSDVSVLLNSTATPQAIADLIETTTISFGGTTGSGTMSVQLSDGNGNNALPGTRSFSIPDPNPSVTLDAGTLVAASLGTPRAISSGATVTDDLSVITSGTLSFSLSGTANDSTLTVPSTPIIGNINNNNTSTVTVDLLNATPADITAVINGTKLAGGATTGTGTVQVDLTDAEGNTAPSAIRDFEIVPVGVFAVANQTNDSVTVHRRDANGDTSPLRTLVGAATTFLLPRGVAIDDVNNELLVVDAGSNSVLVFALTASGDTAPIRTISGGNTGLGAPAGIVVDPVNDEIFVRNGSSRVLVFSRTASGDVAPIRSIFGGNTLLGTGRHMALDLVNNELVVPNQNSVLVFNRTDNGDVAPKRNLTGSATMLIATYGADVDTTNDELIVADSSGDAISVFSRTADGDTAPLRRISGGSTLLNGCFDVALDSVNETLVVSNFSGDQVLTFNRTDNGDVSPLRNVSGAATGFRGPHGISLGQ